MLLSFRLLKKQKRFGNTVTTEEELGELSKGFVPRATRENTLWALNNFQQWKEWRQSMNSVDVIPERLLEGRDSEALNKWLSLYVKETRRKDGKPFPSRTIDMLLCGLKRHMKELNPDAVDILNEKDPRFAGLRGTRDTVSRQLREAGVGATVKHTSVFSAAEEDQLWSAGVLGVDSPRALLNAVFFTVGKTFCLRGGREHEMLKLKQFKFGTEGSACAERKVDFVVYTENGSKNRSGSYKDRGEAKEVKHFANERLGERCAVYLLKLYFSKLSMDIVENGDEKLYFQPKQKTPPNGIAWFKRQHIGRNVLNKMVSQMCENAGIEMKTNHSLRATGATRMFEAGSPKS